MILSFALVPLFNSQPANAASFEYGRWAYNCMHDHKDPYGDVLNPRNCWASICGEGLPAGLGCINVFYFTKERDGLTRVETREACDNRPVKKAVDGVRIDTLPNDEQIQHVLKGKSMTMQVWDFEGKGGWPYCYTTDITFSLKGATEVYKRLIKLKPSFLPGE